MLVSKLVNVQICVKIACALSELILVKRKVYMNIIINCNKYQEEIEKKNPAIDVIIRSLIVVDWKSGLLRRYRSSNQRETVLC